MENDREDVLQWHPAFYADMQIELREEADKLLFQNEYLLSKKPMQIEILIIKKKAGEKIQKNIGRIFRTYNLIEDKSPTDYLAVDDFYKLYGYACFYKSDTGKQNEVPIEEITITFVSKNYPRKMIRHLKDVRKYTIEKTEPGIYYVHGDVMAIQIIVTSQLSPEHNLWLYSLTDTLTDADATRKLLTIYAQSPEDSLYSSVMYVITKANAGQIKEGQRQMMICEPLLELMEEVAGKTLEERVNEMFEEKLPELFEEKFPELCEERLPELLEERKKKALEEGRWEMGTYLIRNLMETLDLSAEKAMELLKITGDEREKYLKILQGQYKIPQG